MDLWNQDHINRPLSNSNGNVIDNILEKIKFYQPESCVFANSFVRLDMQTKDVVTYLQEFYQNAENTESKIQALDDLIGAAGSEPLHPRLLSLMNTIDKCIYIPTASAFDEWACQTGIRDWILVGAHWGICTHEKPLGFENLKNLKNAPTLYSIPSCTLKWVNQQEETVATLEHPDYRNDRLTWEKVADDLYRLSN